MACCGFTIDPTAEPRLRVGPLAAPVVRSTGFAAMRRNEEDAIELGTSMEALILGLGLGTVAGISPGPLLTLVITATLERGVGGGLRVAASPLVSDAPIVTACLLTLTRLAEQWLALLGGLGGVFVIYLGVEMLWRAGSATLEPQPAAAGTQDLFRGALVNALSPHPWLFWFGVGGPAMIRFGEQSYWLTALFVVAFFTCLIGAKALVAVLVARGRGLLGGTRYRWALRICGVLLAALGVLLIVQGYELWNQARA